MVNLNTPEVLVSISRTQGNYKLKLTKKSTKRFLASYKSWMRTARYRKSWKGSVLLRLSRLTSFPDLRHLASQLSGLSGVAGDHV